MTFAVMVLATALSQATPAPAAAPAPAPAAPAATAVPATAPAPSAVDQQAQAAAELNAKLVAGTAVRSRNGTASVGTIKAVEGDLVTLTTVKGDIKFPKTGFSLDPQGVIIGFTADQFNAAIGVK